MDKYSKHFKSLSDVDLLFIIEEPKEYDDSAVEAAKNELKSRNLPESKISDLRNTKLEIQRQRILQNERSKEINRKLEHLSLSLLDKINPFKNGLDPNEVSIRSISIYFSIVLLFKLIANFYSISYLFHPDVEFYIFMVPMYLPFVMIPLGVIYFWRRRKIGWILLAIVLTNSLIGNLISFFAVLGMESSGYTALDSLFPAVSPVTYLFYSLVNFFILREMLKKALTEEYQMGKNYIIQILTISSVIILFIYFSRS